MLYTCLGVSRELFGQSINCTQFPSLCSSYQFSFQYCPTWALLSCRTLFLISLSLILYSNCSRSWILLDLMLRIFGLMGFLSSILLHVSVDSHVLSVLLRYPRVFFAVLQYTSLILFHFPSNCGWFYLFSAQKPELILYFHNKCFQYLILLESGYVLLHWFVFFLGGSFPYTEL